MTDEVKQEKAPEVAPAPGKEPAPQAAPAAGGKDAKKEAPSQKKEKPDKCEQCGKLLNRVKWYYRNSGYYCTRRCWKEYKAKAAGVKSEGAAPAKA
ncbi:MAG: hypothetical protein NT045_07920 [Candidatus Aureabacteria bacterium]|nr:hypothetical protein [Candidatus Auribacterota bacterium]